MENISQKSTGLQAYHLMLTGILLNVNRHVT